MPFLLSEPADGRHWRKWLAQRIVDHDPALLAYGSPYGLYYVLELFDRSRQEHTLFNEK